MTRGARTHARTHARTAPHRTAPHVRRTRHAMHACTQIRAHTRTNTQVMVISHPSEKKKVLIGTVALMDLCLSNFELLQLPEGEARPRSTQTLKP